ncbi:hypothetical protein D3C81_1168580 [compost metagenome]
MPTAVMPQPINTAPTSARAAMFCGNEKIPPPIIDPTTSAISAPRRNFCPGSLMGFPYSRAVIHLKQPYPPYKCVALIYRWVSKAIALITALSMCCPLSKLAAHRQLEQKPLKLEILVKNLRKHRKRLASDIAGPTERLL